MKKQISAYTELLFENRNKEYGAYDLRMNYEKRLARSFILSISIAFFFFLVPYILQRLDSHRPEGESIFKSMPYELSKKITIEPKAKGTPQKAVAPVSAKVHANYKVAKHPVEQKAEEEKKTDQGIVNNNQHDQLAGDSLVEKGNGSTGDSVKAETIEEMSIASVDVPPQFPGGEKAMIKFLQKNLKYSDIAIENKIIGKVYVSFVIDEKGKPVNIAIMRSLGFGMDEEVLRVLSMMPAWTPGRYRDREVKTALILPVSFNLK